MRKTIINSLLLLCCMLIIPYTAEGQIFTAVEVIDVKEAATPMEFKANNAVKKVSISSKQQYIEVTKRGKTIRINPTPPPQASMYIWVSLSPNGKYILYNVPLRGTFVCTIKGKVVAELGKLNAPVWYDNNIILGMDDYDDGENFTKSDVVAVNFRTAQKQIISKETIAVYPYPKKPFVHYFSPNKLITIKLK